MVTTLRFDGSVPCLKFAGRYALFREQKFRAILRTRKAHLISEHTPLSRLRPERSALDRSATLSMVQVRGSAVIIVPLLCLFPMGVRGSSGNTKRVLPYSHFEATGTALALFGN